MNLLVVPLETRFLPRLILANASAGSTAYQARTLLFMIGATSNESSMSGDVPEGSRANRMVAEDSVPQNGAITNQAGNEVTCSECGLTFKKRGLGNHMRLKHAETYNRGINVERTKPRWSDEDVALIAQEEAKVLRSGKVVYMNQHLHQVFPERTLDAIKSKRKSQDYKDLVNRLSVRRSTDNVEAAQDLSTVVEGVTFDDTLLGIIRDQIDGLRNNDLPQTQALIESARLILDGIQLGEGTLSRWLKTTFKDATPPRGIMYRTDAVSANMSKKKQRRQEYAKVQRLFVKDFGSAARRVLSSGEDDVTMPPAIEAIAFWKRIFESEPEEGESDITNTVYEENAQLRDIWAPITVDDIGKCELDLDSAAGPDGVTVANWRGVCAKVRALFYNLVLARGTLDDELKRARTVLIPKGSGNISASNTRPLSITSVVVRQLHKIFAKRFKTLHDFDPSQRAFIDCDGTLENLSIISTILADARVSRSEVHIATLDLRKAFDSVAHKTIFDTITALGCPKHFIRYVKALYTDSRTTLQYGSLDTILKVNQGVLQGDPISPLLFNAVIDRAIRKIPEDIGYRMNGKIFNCVAYADDIILVASTKRGLQDAIDALTSCLASFGLKTNHEKSSTLSLVPSGKEKKIKVIEESQFVIDGVHLHAIGVIETWKYLGIMFSGSKTSGREIGLASDLEKISRAPLKPQQRLKILCTVALPKHLHTLVLGRITQGKLEEYDRQIRRYVRKWLHLPKDVPISYLYADVGDGGLGIPNLTQQVPLIKKSRLTRFINKGNETAQIFKQSFYIKRQLEWCDKLLVRIGEDATKSMKSRHWRDVLHSMVDTNDLFDARHDSASNTWVRSRAQEVSGQDFVHYHHIRAGCLPSKARTTRGRQNNRMCRAGCMVSETNYHIVQQCQRTHGGRVLRHDRIVEMLHDSLDKRDNIKVIKEPHFKTRIGLRKPDLLISRGEKTIVLDVQVVSGRNMERDYDTKCNKYRDIPGFEDLVKRKCATRTVEFQALTISYKGLIEKNTSKMLYNLQINERFKFLMVTSVLRGAWLNWKSFNKMTTMTR